MSFRRKIIHLCFLLSCITLFSQGQPMIANEKIIYRSPDPANIYLYTPALLEGFNGRFVAAVDLGGPGTDKLTGPKSDLGDYKTGNQIRVLLSDDRGNTWRETSARIPMMHEILFKAGKALYMIGHSGRLLITKSLDNGETWSEPAVLFPERRWHQSCGTVDHRDGKVYLVYEKWIYEGHQWPGVAPVLLAAEEDKDLTVAANWTFSKPFNPDPIMVAAAPSGIPALPTDFQPGHPAPGILETSVLRIYDPKHPFFDPNDKTVILLMRAHTGFSDIGAILKGVENPDGSLEISQIQNRFGNKLFYIHIPGANIKFHLAYDDVTKLYWMVHSQIDGRVAERRRLALSFSKDLLTWTFAGLIAVGPSNNGARHYATCMISGDDLFVLSRSGDEHAKNAHDNNLTTFHRVADFRKYAK